MGTAAAAFNNASLPKVENVRLIDGIFTLTKDESSGLYSGTGPVATFDAQGNRLDRSIKIAGEVTNNVRNFDEATFHRFIPHRIALVDRNGNETVIFDSERSGREIDGIYAGVFRNGENLTMRIGDSDYFKPRLDLYEIFITDRSITYAAENAAAALSNLIKQSMQRTQQTTPTADRALAPAVVSAPLQ